MKKTMKMKKNRRRRRKKEKRKKKKNEEEEEAEEGLGGRSQGMVPTPTENGWDEKKKEVPCY